jgi:hypothetical protein
LRQSRTLHTLRSGPISGVHFTDLSSTEALINYYKLEIDKLRRCLRASPALLARKLPPAVAAIAAYSSGFRGTKAGTVRFRSVRGMTLAVSDTSTISELEAQRYDWIAAECCRGTVWVPFRLIRTAHPTGRCRR